MLIFSFLRSSDVSLCSSYNDFLFASFTTHTHTHVISVTKLLAQVRPIKTLLETTHRSTVQWLLQGTMALNVIMVKKSESSVSFETFWRLAFQYLNLYQNKSNYLSSPFFFVFLSQVLNWVLIIYFSTLKLPSRACFYIFTSCSAFVLFFPTSCASIHPLYPQFWKCVCSL